MAKNKMRIKLLSEQIKKKKKQEQEKKTNTKIFEILISKFCSIAFRKTKFKKVGGGRVFCV